VTFEPAHGPLGAEQSHFFETTGHTLHEPFLSFWRSVNGLDMLGYPISEPRWEYVGDRMLQVQYFERGRLEHHPDQMDEANRVQISNLGLALARLRGYDTAAIGPAAAPRSPDLPEHLRRAIGEAETETEAEADRAEETAQQAATRSAEPVAVRQGATPPQQTFFSSSPSAEEADWVVASQAITTTTRRVVVNLAHQRIYAMENGATVFDAPISTGMPGFETPEGNFFIYAKNPLQTMSGDLGGEYSVPNVPNSMYIHDDVAIHGTYWHNEFGTGVRRSHGCINLPLDAAARLYEWAAVGTPVTVTSATQ
jgi:lipoprotein-anchoring transpeptidase ErfK/SrfK